LFNNRLFDLSRDRVQIRKVILKKLEQLLTSHTCEVKRGRRVDKTIRALERRGYLRILKRRRVDKETSVYYICEGVLG